MDTVTINGGTMQGQIAGVYFISNNNSRLIVEGGDIKATGAKGSGVYVKGTPCTVEIKGGQITSERYGISINDPNTVVYVKDGSNISGKDYAVYQKQSSFPSARVYIEGGHLNGKTEAIGKVTGGYFNGAVKLSNKSISGGFFSDEPAVGYLAPGYTAVKNEDVTYKWTIAKGEPFTPVAEIEGGDKYPLLEDAVAAASEGAKIKMLEDEVLPSGIVIDKGLTIDLAGKEISLSMSSPVLNIKAGCEVMVTSTVAGGKVTGSKYGIQNSGKLTIDGKNVTVSGDEASLYNIDKGEASIKGATMVSKLNGVHNKDTAKVNITNAILRTSDTNSTGFRYGFNNGSSSESKLTNCKISAGYSSNEKGTYGVYSTSGILTFNDCHIIGGADGDSGSNKPCYGVWVSSNVTAYAVTINLNGGSVSANSQQEGAGVIHYNTTNTTYKCEININGTEIVALNQCH